MKVVYICHPFRSDQARNARRVRSLCRAAVRTNQIPLAPQILLPQFLDEGSERDLAIACCLRLVSLADEVWVFGHPTQGMRVEIRKARRLGIPVIDGRRS